MNIIKLLVVSFFFEFNFPCLVDVTYEGLKIELSTKDAANSIVKVSYINLSGKDISLPVYILCNDDSLYMDLFEVQKGSGKDKFDLGYYGGLVDFVTNQVLISGEKIVIPAKSKTSCDVDVSTAYSVYQLGDFNLTYVLHKKLLDLRSDPLIVSNTITLKLSPVVQRNKN